MVQSHRSPLWFGAGLFAALAVAAAILDARGTGEPGVQLAVLMAARVAFAFFLPAYAGGAAARLFGAAFQGVARHAREFGLAFAGALSVHLALVAWLFGIAAQPPVGTLVVVTFGIGALFAYSMALLSLEPLGNRLGTGSWRLFRSAGSQYIAMLFFLDFIVFPLRNGTTHPLEYVPFALLIAIGALLRLAACMRRPAPVRAVTPQVGSRAPR
jgi:hypothetical protein